MTAIVHPVSPEDDIERLHIYRLCQSAWQGKFDVTLESSILANAIGITDRENNRQQKIIEHWGFDREHTWDAFWCRYNEYWREAIALKSGKVEQAGRMDQARSSIAPA